MPSSSLGAWRLTRPDFTVDVPKLTAAVVD